MKHFWKEVAVVAEDGGWGIALDGRPVRTPQRAPLAVANAMLAEAVAAEWREAGETIDPAAMPMTGLANAAIDLAAPDPAAFAVPVAAYAESDLFCYRDARDAVLAQDHWRVAALTPLVTIGGSLVAGLALIECAFEADALWEAVSLDDLYQERRWGADSEAQKARAANKRDWDNAARFLGLL